MAKLYYRGMAEQNGKPKIRKPTKFGGTGRGQIFLSCPFQV
jgi:hypothetical protein